MPKDTFFNLPEEKRSKIINAAISEFVSYNYDGASINRIVINSEISKGSFYQYFDDKKDLYKHLMAIIVNEKVKFMTPVMQNPFNHTLFEVLKDLNRSGIEFAKAHPEFMKIGERLMKDTSHPMYEEVMADNTGKAIDIYKALITNAINKKEIREDLDVDLTAKMLFTLNTQLVQFIPNMSSPTWLDDMLKALNNILDVFANGMLASK